MLYALFISSWSTPYPVPKRPTGISWNSGSKDIVVDVFADPLCPGCEAVWGTVTQMITQYRDTVEVRLHTLALPYHTWAFCMTRVLMTAKRFGNEHACKLVDQLYSKGDLWLFQNEELRTKSEVQVTLTMIEWAAKTTGIDVNLFNTKFADTKRDAVIEFKYAALNHIAGTPTFLVNGQQVDLGEDSTIDDWAAVLDPLLNL